MASNSQEFIVRVPSATDKRYNVMRFTENLNVNVTKWKCAKMEREENKRNDSPWILKANDMQNRKFKGTRGGGIGDNSSYYVFFQAHDGAFEAYPIAEWYNFTTIPKYQPLTVEEAEDEFKRRDKVLNLFTVMKRKNGEQSEPGDLNGDVKVKVKKEADFKVTEMDDWQSSGSESGNEEGNEDDGEKPKKGKGKQAKKGKKNSRVFKKKKPKNSDDEGNDSEPLEESDEGDFDTKEHDYFSETSSDDDDFVTEDDKVNEELKAVGDEEALMSTDSEDDEENADGKEANSEAKNEADKKQMNSKSKPKKDSDENSSSSDDDSDDSNDDSNVSSAIFMAKKEKKKQRNKDEKKSAKRETDSESGLNKRLKGNPSFSPLASSSTASSSVSNAYRDIINEDTVRRYLMRKPMTTTDLALKFKRKVTNVSNDEMVGAIAQVLAKLNPDQQTIKGKLHLYIKTS